MSFATTLKTALEGVLGPADDTIHTAIPPMHLGGGADVITFSRAPGIGVVHVSAGLSEAAGVELAICTREPTGWAPTFLSRLAAAGRQRRFVWHGSTPLGGPDAAFGGVLFTHLRRAMPPTIAGRHVQFLLCIGVTPAELAACRSHGTPAVVWELEIARVFPYSVIGRGDVAGIATLGPSPLARPGLSERARRGLTAVVNGHAQEVESLRAKFARTDLELMASAYADLATFTQRCELVNLTQDCEDACLVPMWRALVREALTRAVEANTAEHGALAVALSSLDGDALAFRTYWDDLGAALTKARAHAGVA